MDREGNRERLAPAARPADGHRSALRAFAVAVRRSQGGEKTERIMNIEDLLKYTIESGASDLHLGVESIPSIRINGEIKNLNMPKVDKAMMNNMVNEVRDLVKDFKDNPTKYFKAYRKSKK